MNTLMPRGLHGNVCLFCIKNVAERQWQKELVTLNIKGSLFMRKKEIWKGKLRGSVYFLLHSL